MASGWAAAYSRRPLRSLGPTLRMTWPVPSTSPFFGMNRHFMLVPCMPIWRKWVTCGLVERTKRHSSLAFPTTSLATISQSGSMSTSSSAFWKRWAKGPMNFFSGEVSTIAKVTSLKAPLNSVSSACWKRLATR